MYILCQSSQEPNFSLASAISYFVLTLLDFILGDLWPEGDREKGEEPDYIKTEREQFGTFRDLNKDGKMDKVRIKC